MGVEEKVNSHPGDHVQDLFGPKLSAQTQARSPLPFLHEQAMEVLTYQREQEGAMSQGSGLDDGENLVNPGGSGKSSLNVTRERIR